MASNDPRQSKAQRREEARLKALELRKEQERRAKRNRILAISGIGVLALVLVGAVAFVLQQDRANRVSYAQVVFGGDAANVNAPTLADADPTPSVADDKGGIPVSRGVVGQATEGDTVVSLYFDLQCPACAAFEEVNGADMESFGERDGVTVEYKPLNFLDDRSNNTHYSTRALNAALIVASEDPDHFIPFLQALYQGQPAEGTSGLKDDRIKEIATGVEVPQEVADTFTDTVEGTFTTEDSDEEKTGTWRTYAEWIAAANAQGAVDLGGQVGTPTILIDGQKWDGNWQNPGELAAAVDAAVAAKG